MERKENVALRRDKTARALCLAFAGVTLAAGPRAVPRAHSAAFVPTIFVSDSAAGTVAQYAQASPYQLIRTIQGFGSPTGLAVDRLGNLYVADAGAGQILAFKPGSAKRFATFADPDASPAGIDVDSQLDVVVANRCTGAGCTGAGNVLVYVRGSHKASVTLQGLASPISVAYDARGDIYADGYAAPSQMNPVVGVYQVGTEKFTDLKIPIAVPGTLEPDDPGYLAVEDQAAQPGGVPTVSVYAPLSNKLLATFAIGAAGTFASFALAKNGTQLFSVDVAGSGSGAIAEFTYPGGQPLGQAQIGGSPWGVAVDPETIP